MERDRVDKVIVELPEGMDRGFYEAAVAAGWSDDPGTGRSIRTVDGREIPNPQPMAPPVGYVREDTLEDMVNRHMQKAYNLARLSGDVVLDESAEEAEDFVMDDELPDLRSIYEVVEMAETAPPLPREPEIKLEAVEPPVKKEGAP